MKICILTIATNKYIQFVERLYNDIEKNFLVDGMIHKKVCLMKLLYQREGFYPGA